VSLCGTADVVTVEATELYFGVTVLVSRFWCCFDGAVSKEVLLFLSYVVLLCDNLIFCFDILF
jgi:hypothetical protein